MLPWWKAAKEDNMYKQHYALAILVDGKVAMEAEDVVKVPFSEEFAIRVKNKLNRPVAVDLYVNGELLNKVGQLCIAANSHLDVDRWVLPDKTDRKLIFAKSGDGRIDEPNESENGIVEARFYEINETVSTIIHHHDHWPYFTYVDVWGCSGNCATCSAYCNKRHNVHTPYYPNPIWYCGGTTTNVAGITIGINNVTTGNSILNCNSTYDNSTILSSTCNSVGHMNAMSKGDVGYTTNGAVVQGDKVDDKKTFEKFNSTNNLKSEPTVLKIKLYGYERKKVCCTKCGRRRNSNDLFCGSCGTKY